MKQNKTIQCFSKRTPAGKLVFSFFFILMFLTMYMQPNIVLAESQLSETGTWGYGGSYSVYESNNRLYRPSGRMLEIYDQTDPGSPVLLGRTALPDVIRSVVVEGNRLYAAVANQGLLIVDVSVPSSPAVLGKFATERQYERFDLEVNGNYAYLLKNEELKIIDVSIPGNPTEAATYTDPDFWDSKIKISGNYAYILKSGDNLLILDISNPAGPSMVSDTFLGMPVQGIAVNGDYLYIASDMEGLIVMDVSNPSSPSIAAHLQDHQLFMTNIVVDGQYAYGLGVSGVVVLDVSNPVSPAVAGTLENNLYSARDMQAANNRVYLASEYYGIYVVDASNPAVPVEVKRYGHYDYINDIAVSGSFAFGANGGQGVRAFDISNPQTPVETAVSGSFPVNHDIDISGSHAYINGSAQGIGIFDISNPTNPVFETSHKFTYSVFDLDAVGNYLYVANYFGGLQIMDVSNPSSPAVTGNVAFPNRKVIYDVACDGQYAYVSGSAGYGLPFSVIDVRNPSAPVKIAEIAELTSISDLYISGSYVYAACYRDGLRVIDVNDPGNPVVVGSYQNEDFTPWELVVKGNYIFACGWEKGFYVVDVNDPANPLPIDHYQTPSRADAVFVDGHYAYVPTSDCGFSIIDVSAYIASIRLDSPNGGQALSVGSQYDIRWSTTALNPSEQILIEFSDDNGVTWTEIAETGNTGSFLWTVPANISANCFVRVSAANGTVSDVSDYVFSIAYPPGVDAVPVMTSNTSPSGTASSSSQYNWKYPAWKAFDGNDESGSWSRWISRHRMPQWLAYDFGVPTAITEYFILPEYGSHTRNRSPKNWTLQGWDGSQWVTVDTRSNIRINNEWNPYGLNFQIQNPGVYTKYRLHVTAVNGSSVVSIRQLKLFY